MQKIKILSLIIIATVLMGCPPPVSDNPGNTNTDNSASKPKAIVVTQISAGDFHTMVVKSDDTLWAFGDNQYGQLGNGKSGEAVVETTPVQVMAMTNVKQVSAGGSHSMIVKKDRTLWAVGHNNQGQLGDGTQDDTATPIQVKTTVVEGAAMPMPEVDYVSSGLAHTMIVTKNNELWGFGANENAQLGIQGTAPFEKKPLRVGALTNVKQVSFGTEHSMILTENGELWAAGSNNEGQLGKGNNIGLGEPEKLLDEIAQVSAGSFHTMIVKSDATLWAAGKNNKGQLGNGNSDENITENTLAEVKIAADRPMTEVAQISAGFEHSMILKKNGDLWAVGNNEYGQLGDGTTENKSNPVQVKTATGEPMTQVAQVSAGRHHTIILKKNGSVWAVGSNDKGQLGNGKSGADAKELIPVEITLQ